MPLRHHLKPHKYGVSAKDQRTCEGITFDSRREMLRYQDLLLLKKGGVVLTFLRQVPFHLPGGVIYRLDFMPFWADGTITFEDVKGMRTESYKAKKRMVEDLFAPITITEL